MKTKRTKFRKLSKSILLALLVIAVQSCETEIPITDTVDPEFTFQLTGDGFNRSFDQDTNFSGIQLNLRDNTAYDFTYTGTDSGGVEIIQWQADTGGSIVFETPISSPWSARDISPLSRIIEWRGDRNDPVTGSVITGRFRTGNGNVSLLFRFNIRDFGGERRVPNQSNGVLNLYIANQNTEVINL